MAALEHADLNEASTPLLPGEDAEVKETASRRKILVSLQRENCSRPRSGLLDPA